MKTSKLSSRPKSTELRREQLEDALLNNRVKALVATTALGMGYDKPDLAFVIHYQTPGSVVAYYQQVGCAGRAIGLPFHPLLEKTEQRPEQKTSPMKDKEIATALEINNTQVKAWLERLVKEGILEKIKGAGYNTRQRQLFD